MGATLQGQYGGAQAPAISPANGGSAVLSTLGTAAMGMLTGGGSVAIQAAMEASKDQPTQQNPTSTATQKTGNKIFNLQPATNAMQNNTFWGNALGVNGGGGSLVLFGVLGLVGLVFFLILRRK